jgi:pimeloyl-ACP methyl ester carboxylesterase
MSISTSTLVGFSDLVYKDLPSPGATLEVNGIRYTVYQTLNDTSNSYQGMILIDNTTHSLIVVNRGTQELEDWGIDAAMADKDVNLQWPDALNLAQQAKDYADANGITNIYAVGHSLGGTLAQMQAAYFGWKGVTFNAYGADELYKAMPGYSISPNADITNYRTLYDLVSDASVQIGTVQTLETPDDQRLFASGISGHPIDFINQTMADHSISNFFDAGTDTGGTDHIYQAVAAFDFSPSPRTVAIAQDRVAAVVADLELSVGALAAGTLPFLIPRNMQDVQQAAAFAWEYLTGDFLTGMSSDIPADPTLLQNALNPDPADNAYVLRWRICFAKERSRTIAQL